MRKIFEGVLLCVAFVLSVISFLYLYNNTFESTLIFILIVLIIIILLSNILYD
nr:MAG TPA: hypothetical protein [Caudoviricetes sp.]